MVAPMVTPPSRFGTPAGARRVVAIGLTAALHAAALLVFLLPATRATPAQAELAIATFDTQDEGGTKPVVHRAPQPRKVVPPPPLPFVAPPVAIELPRVSPVVAAMLEQADAQASAGGCDLTGPVQAALQGSAEVQRALPAIPQQRRSVANAIAIWDQRWVAADALLDARTLDTVRTAITMTITAASPACRAQTQAGPRLIYVPVATQTTVLALGSGQWTWQQVADSAEDVQPGADAAGYAIVQGRTKLGRVGPNRLHTVSGSAFIRPRYTPKAIKAGAASCR